MVRQRRAAVDRTSRGNDDYREGYTRRKSYHVVPEAHTEIVGEHASSYNVTLFSVVVFLLVFGVGFGVAGVISDGVWIIAIICGLLLALLAIMSMHIAQEWEKVVVLRLGRFNRVSGPGLFWSIPIIEGNTMRVDGRVRSTTFGAEETLTADLVPLDVNAVLFWLVWDPRSACVEVGNFTRSVELAAQTALRDAIGRAGVAEVAIRREQLDREIKKVLEDKVSQWGITILSVEVRDILLPKDLHDVMSMEAQAEQRKKARIILTEAEEDMCEMMTAVGEAYADNEAALRLRSMHLLYESVRETGGTVVVPSSFSEGFGDVLPDKMKDTLGNMGN